MAPATPPSLRRKLVVSALCVALLGLLALVFWYLGRLEPGLVARGPGQRTSYFAEQLAVLAAMAGVLALLVSYLWRRRADGSRTRAMRALLAGGLLALVPALVGVFRFGLAFVKWSLVAAVVLVIVVVIVRWARRGGKDEPSA
ncbi:MAG TPA: hypothetical protein VGQ83_12405 [Polyangia bacterium]|jgi:hypothetical protein